MEPTAESPCCKKFTDVELDKLILDLIELEKTMEPAAETTSPEKFTDFDLDKLVHDLIEFENAEPILDLCDLEFENGAFKTDNMFKELQMSTQIAEKNKISMQHYVSVTETSHLGTVYNVKENCFGMSSFAERFEGNNGVVVDPFVRYFSCKESRNRYELPTRPRRKKRKYKGIVETEEETARRLEYTKIRNREAATKAHEKKLERETHLKMQLHKQHERNKFLKNMLTFLQDSRRVDVTKEPLRRTMSGPL